MASARGEELFEVCPSVLANLQNDAVLRLRQKCAETKTHQLQRVTRRQISKANSKLTAAL